MTQNENILTNKSHWEESWQAPIKMRLPRKASSGVLNIMRLLESKVKPSDKYLEIGCAPGKLLAWVAATLKARVSGVDYSTNGMHTCSELFKKLSLEGDLRCENIFECSFKEDTFDIVFSNGVIEHFKDPRELIEIHLKLLKPGGKAIIQIPNYSGIYLKMQRFFDPENLAIHNLEIMEPSKLLALAPHSQVKTCKVYYYGSFSPDLISWNKKLPAGISRIISLSLNICGMLQPLKIKAVCSNLVLEFVKADKA